MKIALGVDFGGTKIAVAVCGLDGRCLARQVTATGAQDGGEVVFSRGVSAGRELVAGLAAGGRGVYELAGVGISTIGVPRDDGVELAPAIPGWEGVALARSAREAFNAPVAVATDVKAAASVEARWGALAGADPALYLNLGTGLAAAIVVGGRVVQGAHGASGEIGYNLVGPVRASLGAGARPVLEGTVSGMGLAAGAGRLLGRQVTAEEVFEQARIDARLEAVVSSFVGELSQHLVNLVIALDPSRVAVGGGMANSWDRLQGPLEAALKSGVPFPPELVLASRPFDAPLVGALALGVEAAGADLAWGPSIPAMQH
jgi:glucokinase